MDFKPYKTKIREAQLDVFGHVNNAVYLELFEEARWEFLEQRGYGLKRMQTTGHGVVVLKAELRFIRELHNRQEIEIDMRVTNVRRKLFTVEQSIRTLDGVECATACFLLGFWDMKQRKLMAANDEWLRALE